MWLAGLPLNLEDYEPSWQPSDTSLGARDQPWVAFCHWVPLGHSSKPGSLASPSSFLSESYGCHSTQFPGFGAAHVGSSREREVKPSSWVEVPSLWGGICLVDSEAHLFLFV